MVEDEPETIRIAFRILQVPIRNQAGTHLRSPEANRKPPRLHPASTNDETGTAEVRTYPLGFVNLHKKYITYFQPIY